MLGQFRIGVVRRGELKGEISDSDFDCVIVQLVIRNPQFRNPKSPCDPLVPRLRFSNLHQPISAALFRGFDDLRRRSRSTAFSAGWATERFRDERHERRNAKLGEFFDEPLLPVAFGKCDADRGSANGSSRSISFRSTIAQFDICATQGDNGRFELGTGAVEECDSRPHGAAHHMEQVMGFGTVEHHAAGGNRVW